MFYVLAYCFLLNRVLDSSGYIKIVDYGFCKKLPDNSTTNTMCGTPEYIPPEMVRSRPHTRAVDLWSFGVFLYELATRGTPFEHNETVGNNTSIFFLLTRI